MRAADWRIGLVWRRPSPAIGLRSTDPRGCRHYPPIRRRVLSDSMLPFLRPQCDSLRDRKSTRLNSSHGYISYAVFCLKKKKNKSRDYNSTKGLYTKVTTLSVQNRERITCGFVE